MLLWSDLASTAIVAIGTVVIVALPIAVVATIALELTGRRQPWLIWITVGLLGFLFGLSLLLSDDDPGFRAFTLVVAAVVAGLLLRRGQRGLAGWLIVFTALPWAVFAGSVVLDAVSGAPEAAAGPIIVPFILSAAAIAVGIWLVASGRGAGTGPAAAPGAPDAADAGGSPPATSWVGPVSTPPARAWDAAGRAAVGPTVFGLSPAALVGAGGIVVGAGTTVSVAHGRSIPEVVAIGALGAILTGLLATLLWALAWPPRSRRAFEAFAWLGEWDLERFRDLAGGRVAGTLPNILRYVREAPETPGNRWIRVEALASSGELAAARAMAERLPVDTVLERAEKATYLPYLDWLGGGPGDPAALRAAIAEIEPADGDERLRGEVSVALAEVRQRVAAGDPDPAAPLRAVRDRIGRRADGVLFTAARRRMLAGHLRLAAAFVVALMLLDRAFAR
jgi:hypothetical protein